MKIIADGERVSVVNGGVGDSGFDKELSRIYILVCVNKYDFLNVLLQRAAALDFECKYDVHNYTYDLSSAYD